jgi:hypothetical protein
MENDLGETLWCEAEEGHEEYNALGRMPIAKTVKMAQSYYSARYTEEHLQSRVDELNSLYVALTRASCNMFIWAQDSGKGFSVWNLLSMCLNPEGQYTDGVFLQEDGEPVLTIDEEKASDNG